MSPRHEHDSQAPPASTDVTKPASTSTADAPVPTQSPPEDWTVSFHFDGLLSIISVQPSMLGMGVYELLATQLEIPVNRTEVEVLKTPEESWPTQEESASAPGKALKYLPLVQGQLQDLKGVVAVQLRVKTLSAKTKRPRKSAVAWGEIMPLLLDLTAIVDEAEETEQEGYESTMDNAIEKLKTAFDRAKRGKRKASSQSMAFSSCNKAFMEEVCADLKKSKYEQEQLEIPPEYMERLCAQYTSLVKSSKEPWLENESNRRMFITSVLSTCVEAVKDEDKSKKDLYIHTEHALSDEDVSGSGKADFIVTLSKRMIIVVEAKQCDMERALRHNLAAMEVACVLNAKTQRREELRALRNVKTVDESTTQCSLHNIQGICTDFQNWIFVKRASRKFSTKHMVCRTPETVGGDPEQLPLDMVPIINHVYRMLKLL